MGRVYVIPWTGTVTNAGGNTDLWEILPADDQPVSILMLRLGQTSEVKDAEEEGLRVAVRRFRATVTSGSGGSAGAPEEVTRANQAPAFAVEINNTTVATTSGDNEVLDEIAWINRQSPLDIVYPEAAMRPKAIQGEGLIIRLESTVADDMTFAGNIWVEEGP
jgi:hypothetical protein